MAVIKIFIFRDSFCPVSVRQLVRFAFVSALHDAIDWTFFYIRSDSYLFSFGFQLHTVLDLNKPIDYFVIYFQYYYWPFANKISNIKCGNVLAAASELTRRVNGVSFMVVWMSARFFFLLSLLAAIDDRLGHVTDEQLAKPSQD